MHHYPLFSIRWIYNCSRCIIMSLPNGPTHIGDIGTHGACITKINPTKSIYWCHYNMASNWLVAFRASIENQIFSHCNPFYATSHWSFNENNNSYTTFWSNSIVWIRLKCFCTFILVIVKSIIFYKNNGILHLSIHCGNITNRPSCWRQLSNNNSISVNPI